MKNYEGGRNFFCAIPRMGRERHHSPMKGQLFLHFWNNLPFYFHPSLLLLKGTTFYYKMGQPPVIKKLVMKNYEGGGEKFLPVTCMGSGNNFFLFFWTIILVITADDIHPTFLMILDNQLMVSGVYGLGNFFLFFLNNKNDADFFVRWSIRFTTDDIHRRKGNFFCKQFVRYDCIKITNENQV